MNSLDKHHEKTDNTMLQIGEMKGGSTEKAALLNNPVISFVARLYHPSSGQPSPQRASWDTRVCQNMGLLAFQISTADMEIPEEDKLKPSTFLGQTVANAMAAPESLMDFLGRN